MDLLFTDHNIVSYLKLITTCTLTSIILLAIYRLYLHPLRNYRGPRLWAITRIPHAYYVATGRLPFKLAELHERYGPVMRVAPDELTYILEEAWQDIYGKPQPRNRQLQRDPAQFVSSPSGAKSILEEPNDEMHARMRRNLAPGFSDKVLKDQERYMNKYFDLLMQRLHENAVEGPVNVRRWYDFFTFDLIGELSFGESFGCLEESELSVWPRILHKAARMVVILGMIKKFWPLEHILMALAPASARSDELIHRQMSTQKLLQRLEVKEPRPDFMWYAQKNLDKPDGMSLNELAETAGFFIVAGAETTSALLGAVTYYLLMNPQVLEKLNAEVRSTFKTKSDITISSVNALPYLLAVLSEATRLYSPAPGSSYRLTPPSGCIIAGRWVPGNTCVALNQYSAFRSPLNFSRPKEFLPERWLGAPEFENDKKKVLQPFSVGPRNCLGRGLAQAETRVVMARIIYEFDMEICVESRHWLEGQRAYLLWAETPPLLVKLTPFVRTRGFHGIGTSRDIIFQPVNSSSANSE